MKLHATYVLVITLLQNFVCIIMQEKIHKYKKDAYNIIYSLVSYTDMFIYEDKINEIKTNVFPITIFVWK